MHTHTYIHTSSLFICIEIKDLGELKRLAESKMFKREVGKIQNKRSS